MNNRELDLLSKSINQPDESFDVNTVESDDDLTNMITVRVMTKNGIKKWEMMRVKTHETKNFKSIKKKLKKESSSLFQNEPFKKIFEDLAKIENTQMETLVLMLAEKILQFSDTPASVDLQIGDILGRKLNEIILNLFISLKKLRLWKSGKTNSGKNQNY